MELTSHTVVDSKWARPAQGEQSFAPGLYGPYDPLDHFSGANSAPARIYR